MRFPGLLRRKEYRGLFWIEVAMEIVVLYVLVTRIREMPRYNQQAQIGRR